MPEFRRGGRVRIPIMAKSSRLLFWVTLQRVLDGSWWMQIAHTVQQVLQKMVRRPKTSLYEEFAGLLVPKLGYGFGQCISWGTCQLILAIEISIRLYNTHNVGISLTACQSAVQVTFLLLVLASLNISTWVRVRYRKQKSVSSRKTSRTFWLEIGPAAEMGSLASAQGQKLELNTFSAYIVLTASA